MSQTRICPKCRGNIVEPAFEGDGAYPVGRMCQCPENQPNPSNVFRGYLRIAGS